MDIHTEERFLQQIQQEEPVEYEDCSINNLFLNCTRLSIFLLFFLVALTLTTFNFLDHSNLPKDDSVEVEVEHPAAQNPELESDAKTVLEAKQEAESKTKHISGLNKDSYSDIEPQLDYKSGDEESMLDNETYYTPNTKLRKSKPYYYTLDELRQCTGSKPNSRILMAVNKNVYDVTRNKRFYGPGQPCSIFAGNNVESKTWENVIKCKYNCVGKLLLTSEEESETPMYRF